MKRRLQLVALAVVCAGGIGVARADTSPIAVSDVWSRPATGMGVVYATIRNASATPDELVAATSPLATKIELHKSTAAKMPGPSPSMGTMQMSGSMMSMEPVSSIPIPAHGTVSLAPGGYHLMLYLRSDLKAGQAVSLRLHFQRAGWISTTSHVRPIQ